VLEVSALERVRGDVSPRDWPALVDGLARLAHDAGAGLVERAGWRGLAALADRLRRRLTEERAALLRPADESAARVVELQRCARDAEQALVELTHRFDAEEERLMGDLEVERVHFIAEAQPRAIAALDARRASDAGTSRRAALAAAQEIVEPIVAAWRIERGADAERRFSAIVERYVSEANAFLSRLRDAGGPLAAGLAESLPAPPPLHPRSGYHFQPVLTESSPRVGTRLLDAVRSSGRRRAVARRAAEAFVQRLLDVNSSRAIGDLVSRAVESRRAVEASVRRALRAVVVDGAAAAGRAREIQTRGADAVRAAVSALDEHLSAIAAFDE
jgi:hypothetical protein